MSGHINPGDNCTAWLWDEKRYVFGIFKGLDYDGRWKIEDTQHNHGKIYYIDIEEWDVDEWDGEI